MKVDQLRQLIEVSKTKSINQAAMNLYISQPNLSLSLRKLEAELGYVLFVRSNRGIEFTTKGKKFVDYASSVLLQFDHLKALYSDPTAESGNSFSLANMRFRYVVEAASILYTNHKNNQPFKLFIAEGGRDKVIDLVYQGESEIGILNIWSPHRKAMLSQIKAKDVQYYRLSSNPPTVVIGKGNPLYYADPDFKLDIQMLQNYPHAMYEEFDFGTYDNTAKMLELNKTAGQIVVDSRSALYELLDYTDAFTLSSTNQHAYTHASYYPFARSYVLENSDISCDVGWIKRRDYTPSTLALEFIQLLSTFYE